MPGSLLAWEAPATAHRWRNHGLESPAVGPAHLALGASGPTPARGTVGRGVPVGAGARLLEPAPARHEPDADERRCRGPRHRLRLSRAGARPSDTPRPA